MLSHGGIIFTEATRSKQSARFAVVKDDTPVETLTHLLQTEWKLKPPSVLLSVTGSAQDMKFDHGSSLEQVLKHGIAAAASSTEAWVFTGGMDVGVMALTGVALRSLGGSSRGGDTDEQTPCIGIAPWRKVTHREKVYVDEGLPSSLVSMESNKLEEVVYVKRRANSRESAALDHNHTHFLLVDNGKEQWGGEVALRARFEQHLADTFKVPHVLLVIKGGPGTYATVRSAVDMSQRIILVKESHGAAQVIAEYINDLMKMEVREKSLKERLAARDRQFDSRLRKLLERNIGERPNADQLNKTKEDLHYFASRLELFSIFDSSVESFDVAVLQAIVSSFKATQLNESLAVEKARRVRTLQQLDGSGIHHRSARGVHPEYPAREPVPDDFVPWAKAWETTYEATRYTADVVLENDRDQVPPEEKPRRGWADPDLPMVEDADGDEVSVPFTAEFLSELRGRLTFEHREGMEGIAYDDLGRPLNPRGRTGMSGRGLLGKWGPNHAADPIVTRINPFEEGNKLQMVAILRRDTQEWAIPGGMVDDGETVSRGTSAPTRSSTGSTIPHPTPQPRKPNPPPPTPPRHPDSPPPSSPQLDSTGLSD